MSNSYQSLFKSATCSGLKTYSPTLHYCIIFGGVDVTTGYSTYRVTNRPALFTGSAETHRSYIPVLCSSKVCVFICCATPQFFMNEDVKFECVPKTIHQVSNVKKHYSKLIVIHRCQSCRLNDLKQKKE